MNLSRLVLLLALACTLLIVCTAVAGATTVQYFDQPTWSSATTGVTTINFEGAGANYFAPADYSNSTGYMVSGVDFLGYLSSGAFALSVVAANYMGTSTYNFGSGASLRGPWYSGVSSPLPYIQVVLPANTTAFATNLASVSPNGDPFQITLSDGSTYTVSTPSTQTLGFFGITSTTPIAYVDFAVVGSTQNTNYSLLDNFQFGAGAPPPADAPEAATMIMIGSGLLVLNSLRKHQARRRETQRPAAGLWSFVQP